MSRHLSNETWEKIREEILNGKSKLQVSKEYELTYKKVRECTKDIKSIKGGISNNLRKKIREEVKNGKTKRQVAIQHGVTDKTVYYHTRDICSYPLRNLSVKDKKNDATRAFLENSQRKIISYQELKQVTRVFDANLDIKEKRSIVGKNRSRKLFKNKEKRSSSLLKDDDSLAFFHIREYLGQVVPKVVQNKRKIHKKIYIYNDL